MSEKIISEFDSVVEALWTLVTQTTARHTGHDHFRERGAGLGHRTWPGPGAGKVSTSLNACMIADL